MKGGAMTTRDNNLETMDSALSQNYHSLYDDACGIIEEARVRAYKAVNVSLTLRNWRLGERIAKDELDGAERAEYGKRVIPPMADFRRTIWWQPDITTDAQGKAKVEFFNNSTCEEMYISVEGMTSDGKILVNE